MSTTTPLLLLATSNPGKIDELRQLLADLPIRLESLRDHPGAPEVIEDGDSYLANATLKATAVARWSGCTALADDSGLEVDALQGAPGIHSARYAGSEQDSKANMAKLLEALAAVPPERRTARFRCVLVASTPQGDLLTAEGVHEGWIGDTPRGSGGFGYDPVFRDAPNGTSLAELPPEIKNRISHRARACVAIRPHLLGFLTSRSARRVSSAR